MGHQFSYYLIPNDFHTALDHIRQCGDYALLHYRSPEAKARVVSNAEFRAAGKCWFSFWLARAEDLYSIRMREVPAQHYWVIDDKSSVIEFGACYFDGKHLRKSRMFYEDAYYDSNRRAFSKPEPFLKWAKCVFATMKKTLKLDLKCSAYIGQDTLAWVKDGGVLVKPWEEIPGENKIDGNQ